MMKVTIEPAGAGRAIECHLDAAPGVRGRCACFPLLKVCAQISRVHSNTPLSAIRSYRIWFIFLKQIEGTEKEWPAQLVVLAMGFVSPESAISKPLKLELDQVIVDAVLRVV